jgi:hypothetical protein
MGGGAYFSGTTTFVKRVMIRGKLAIRLPVLVVANRRNVSQLFRTPTLFP